MTASSRGIALPERARARAHALADLARDHGIADADGVLIPLRLSQKDVARLVGLTRESVNVVFQDFRHKGWIETTGRNIRVKKPDALAAVQ